MRNALWSLVFCAALVLVVSACGNASGLGAGPVEGTPFPPNQGRLNEIADAVSAAGAQRFADVFAGVAIDTDQDKALVWRKASRAFDAYIAGQSWRSSVRISDARHSRAELQVVLNELRADHEDWKGRGIVLHELVIRQDGSCVEVGAQDPAKAESALAGRFPGTSLCVVQGQGRVPLSGGG